MQKAAHWIIIFLSRIMNGWEKRLRGRGYPPSQNGSWTLFVIPVVHFCCFCDSGCLLLASCNSIENKTNYYIRNKTEMANWSNHKSRIHTEVYSSNMYEVASNGIESNLIGTSMSSHRIENQAVIWYEDRAVVSIQKGFKYSWNDIAHSQSLAPEHTRQICGL